MLVQSLCEYVSFFVILCWGGVILLDSSFSEEDAPIEIFDKKWSVRGVCVESLLNYCLYAVK